MGVSTIIYYNWSVTSEQITNTLATLDSTAEVTFYYAWPFVDTFTISLEVVDSSGNRDVYSERYTITECCPEVISGGGGGMVRKEEEEIKPLILVKRVEYVDKKHPKNFLTVKSVT